MHARKTSGNVMLDSKQFCFSGLRYAMRKSLSGLMRECSNKCARASVFIQNISKKGVKKTLCIPGTIGYRKKLTLQIRHYKRAPLSIEDDILWQWPFDYGEIIVHTFEF